MCGVDYSEKALELAQKACEADTEKCSYSKTCSKVEIKFKMMDLMQPKLIDQDLKDLFSCIIDKGTLDAISLTDGTKGSLFQQHCKNYLRSVFSLFKKSNNPANEKFFIIVSCNFTKYVFVPIIT